ncbi:AAA family ATPase [Myxococcota bacterium]
MTYAHIRCIHATDFGCLRNVGIKLTPLHALIGPNDSGKSTVLRAIRSIVQLASGRLSQSEDLPWHQPRRKQPPSKINPKLSITIGKRADYTVEFTGDSVVEFVTDAGRILNLGKRQLGDKSLLDQYIKEHAVKVLLKNIKGVRLVRFDPDALRKPSNLIPEHDIMQFVDHRGMGLPGIYDAINSRGDDSFNKIVEEVRRIFPTVARLRLPSISYDQKILEVELHSGEKVPAQHISEGMLYYLAFVAIPYLKRTSVLLVEEPENGLHPARIKEVMRTLREITKKTQVIVATHSPLVINEMEGNEVTVLRRDQKKGTQASLLSATPNFEERKKVYALGELWLSYADGDKEEPLFTPPKKRK